MHGFIRIIFSDDSRVFALIHNPLLMLMPDIFSDLRSSAESAAQS
jgi:hypothetical protein